MPIVCISLVVDGIATHKRKRERKNNFFFYWGWQEEMDVATNRMSSACAFYPFRIIPAEN